MNYQERIVRDPQSVGGETVLKGTRVTLKTGRLPRLAEEDIRAAIAFAPVSAQQDLPLVETPVTR